MKAENAIRIEPSDNVRIAIASNGTILIDATGKDVHCEKASLAIAGHLSQFRKELERHDKEQYRAEKCNDHALEDRREPEELEPAFQEAECA